MAVLPVTRAEDVEVRWNEAIIVDLVQESYRCGDNAGLLSTHKLWVDYLPPGEWGIHKNTGSRIPYLKPATANAPM